MNLKVLNELERVLKASPQVLRDKRKLQQIIQATFNIWLDDVSFRSIGNLVDKIDDAVLSKYFGLISLQFPKPTPIAG